MNHLTLTLKNYHALLRVKPPALKPRYPYVAMDEKEALHTMKQIELVYQNLVTEAPPRNNKNGKKQKNYSKNNKTGGGRITVITL